MLHLEERPRLPFAGVEVFLATRESPPFPSVIACN